MSDFFDLTIYSPEDILNNINSPRVIMKWKMENGFYALDS